MERFELSRLAAHAPKACVYANFTTSPKQYIYLTDPTVRDEPVFPFSAALRASCILASKKSRSPIWCAVQDSNLRPFA